jgi:hypothetical protein
VDRAVIPSILDSAHTIFGENLIPQINLPPIRRLDIFKALFSFVSHSIVSAGIYPFLPSATSHAMGALKRSVHNCYFCCNMRSVPLAEEIAFFQKQGRIPALDRLLTLRRNYEPSLSFTLSCLPAVTRLHLRTARLNTFPKAIALKQ